MTLPNVLFARLTRGFALFALTLPTIAAAADPAPVVKAVEEKYAAVEALTANFTQTTHSELYGSEEQKGEVSFKRPRKMRWDFEGDQGKQYITDGATMWIFARAENQVFQYDDLSAAANGADSLLQSLDHLDEHFVVDLVDDEVPGHTLNLKPKAEGQMKQMTLQLSETLVPEKVVMTDSFDNVTELAFQDVQLNASVPDSTFVFQVPEGAEVIKSGGL